LTELSQTFTNNLLPILLISGAGFLLGKFLKVEPRPIGRVTFYILSPLLVFNLLTESQLSLDRIGLMMGYAAAVNFLVAGLAYLIGRLLRLDRPLSISAVVRLLVGPFVGLGLGSLFGLNNPARQAGVTEAAMPSAVLTTVLASEYNLDSSLVTAIVFVTTLLSPFTLTPLLLYLGR